MLDCSYSQKSVADVHIETENAPEIFSETLNSNGTSQTSMRTQTRTRKKPGVESENVSGVPKGKSTSQTRKSMRSRVLASRSRGAYNSYNGKGTILKSRSRRHVFKKEAHKLGNPPAPIRLRTCVFHEDVWYHVGDIVSLLDVDGEIFYAQIRGLATDFAGDNCCFLTWLIPVSGCRDEEFRPSDYIIGCSTSYLYIFIGMEEDVLRDLNCCKLVCRCPADYFQPIASPYTIQTFK
ncbi:GATA zinc finger domain-containing protein 1 [Schistosoma japonicum]|nr:GATA zinc finger domain-containing protein 1 [Schistosoma japonicum]